MMNNMAAQFEQVEVVGIMLDMNLMKDLVERFGSNHCHVHHNSGGRMIQLTSVVTFPTLCFFASEASYSQLSSYLLLTS